MTRQDAIKKLIEVALAEEGYLEKATNANLDSKTANAGYNNYTKYARDHAAWGTYNASKQGYAWCEMFVDWCFIKTFGFDTGMKMTCQPKGQYGAGCTMSYSYYKQAGQAVGVQEAAAGDQIFFGTAKEMTHTGLIYKVDANTIYTIEGNTRAGSNQIVANGGGVFRKSYSRSFSGIGGIGRPRWSLIDGTAQAPVSQPAVQYAEATRLGGVFAEIPFSSIAHIEHVKMNAARGETIDSVAKRAKWNGKAPSIVINAELYNLKDFSPASGVKHNGVLELAGWQPGFGFENEKTPVFQGYAWITTKDWVGGYPAVIRDGKKSFTVPAGLNGAAYRTMIGVKGETLGILVTKNRCSIDDAANVFAAEKYENVINLDGGASSCYTTPERSWTRQAKLRGYLAIWLTSGAESALSGKKASGSSSGSQSGASASTATFLHDVKYKAGKTLTVTANVLNMRAANGKVMTTLKKGAACQWYGYYTKNLPGMSGKFLYVISGKYTGFVSEQYVR